MTGAGKILFWATLTIALVGCGTDKSGMMTALPVKDIVKAQIERMKALPTPPANPAPAVELDAATLAEGRKALEASGTPVMAVSDPTLGIATFMTPIGTNSGVITWANPAHQTVSTRNGVILATRGLVTDLMSADAPSAEQLRSGQGTYRRVNYILDGADRTRGLEMTCRLSVSKGETIAILGKSYVADRIDEVCKGAAGEMTNVYWFDESGVIRQSRQARSPGVENLLLQAIID